MPLVLTKGMGAMRSQWGRDLTAPSQLGHVQASFCGLRKMTKHFAFYIWLLKDKQSSSYAGNDWMKNPHLQG